MGTVKRKMRAITDRLRMPRLRARGLIMTPLVAGLAVAVGLFVVSFWPNSNPEAPKQDAIEEAFTADSDQDEPPVGYYTTESLIRSLDVIVNKRGGFLSNDVLPPFVLMDNIAAWETGAIRQARDLSLALRNDVSRSQSQSNENPNLVQAQILLNNDSERWIFPSAEGKYNDAIEELRAYRDDLVNPETARGDFYARADNLATILDLMNKRLGSMSQNLAASVAEKRRATMLANDPSAAAAKAQPVEQVSQTPWMQVDNVFYQARGTTWAMLVYLKAIKRDFRSVLEDKNAMVSLEQIIRELEYTQRSMTSPMVLNGSQFGMVPNYSLTMSSYLTRANAGLINIISLLRDG
ncbi:DUF2333 family protein [uncultured Halovibrio sp.]|uniref:DUF2333 family protein n=1 Tax=uncultured Halovibrio sp. TaxID=985049 RepID=UPI0025D923AF|nr:DUF2333 family protein [uncultured Halovibrio sp.]